MKCRLFAANRDQPANKVEQILLAIVELPVQPGYFVVLAVSVVVAALRVTDFVAGQQHGNTLREKQSREKSSLFLFAKVHDLRIISRAFGAAIPTVVVVRAVAVFFAVGLVVLVVVRHQIVEREAIMARDEIDAG